MIKKIKKAFYAVFAFTIVATPVAALAQFTTPTTTGGLSDKSILVILQTLMNWLLSLIGVLGILGFVVAGILYITAAGDEDKITSAKKTMTWSIVGVLVALLGLVMVRTVDAILKGGGGGAL